MDHKKSAGRRINPDQRGSLSLPTEWVLDIRLSAQPPISQIRWRIFASLPGRRRAWQTPAANRVKQTQWSIQHHRAIISIKLLAAWSCMRVYNGLADIDPPLSGATLTIGNFDGVHRGHQLILAQACLTASRTGGEAVAMTFDPHPLAVLNPSRAPTPLTLIDERIRLMAACGIGCAVVMPCTKELLSLTAAKFVEQIVVPHFKPKSLVEGTSWRFGRRRSGDVETLAALGRRFGFEVTAVPSMTMEVEPGQDVLVSSSLIRDFIGQHQVERAAACLGRPYALVGEVVPGKRRGAQMGFPTANLEVSGQLVPPSGVYAGQACLSDRQQPAAISIGRAPTFGAGELTVEAYILDFDGELHGRPMRLEFFRWLRPQRTFDSVDGLREQIGRDVQVVRAMVQPDK